MTASEIQALEPKGLCVTYSLETIEMSISSYLKSIREVEERYIPFDNSDLVEVSRTECCCPECAKYQGRVYSLKGMDKRFPHFPRWLSDTKCAHCSLQVYPFIYGLSRAIYVGDDAIAGSNRPFIDDRPKENIDNYYRIIAEYEEEQEDRRIFTLLQETVGTEAPKTFSAYRRMKKQKSKGYLKLAEIASLHGIELKI